MNLQENQALQKFLEQLVQAGGIAKDPQAEALIARAVAQQPDAAYLLVQRAMLLEQALDQAKAQIAQLQDDLKNAQTSSTPSFLESANDWGNSAGRNMRPAAGFTQSSLGVNPAPAASQAMPAARSGFFGGNGSSFLGTMAATAAGVAGGAFLFHGIESLLNHSSSPGAGLLGSGMAPELSSGLSDTPVEHAAAEQFDASELSALDSDGDTLSSLDADTDLPADDDLSPV